MFSKNLKNFRNQKGLSQEELAERLHVVRQTVSKWEKGLSVPDADILIRIAEIFEVSVSVLLGDTIELSEGQGESNIIAQKLEQLNSLLAEKNRRSRRVWKTVKIILISFAVIILLLFILSLSTVQKLRESSTITTEQNAQITEIIIDAMIISI